MNKSESIAELAKSLAQFQKEVKQPQKAGFNPHFKSKYVTLDDTIKAINETAYKHGLSYIQMPINDDNGIGVITTILHESGQYIEFPPFALPMDKRTAQGAGSGLTYARRYSISAAFGLVSEEDDDANAVSGSANKKPPKLIIAKQVAELKTKCLTFAKLRDKTLEAVYSALKFSDIEKLREEEFNQHIKQLDVWISKVEKGSA